MKLTKTLLTTTLFAFSTAIVSPVSYANDAETQFLQALQFAEAKEYHKAFNLFKSLAERGHSKSQEFLGLSYLEGKGVKQDYDQAFKWFHKAAEQGEAVAQSHLGGMYSRGRGVKQDYFQAVKWYQKSAEQGNGYGQRNLAISYYLGKGVKEDRQQAKYWFGKACDNGNQQACDMYRELNEGK